MQTLPLPAELLAPDGFGRMGSHYLCMCAPQAPLDGPVLMVTQTVLVKTQWVSQQNKKTQIWKRGLLGGGEVNR